MMEFKLEKDGLGIYVKDEYDSEMLKRKLSKMRAMFSSFLKVLLYLDSKLEDSVSDIILDIRNQGFKIKRIFFIEEAFPQKIHESDVGLKIITKNIRSGQVIIDPGDLLIIGNINHGAEVVAGGSVVVYGGIYGVVKAGLNKGYDSVVIGLDFRPTLIQIVDKTSHEKCGGIPAIAYFKSGRIIVQPWEFIKNKEEMGE